MASKRDLPEIELLPVATEDYRGTGRSLKQGKLDCLDLSASVSDDLQEIGSAYLRFQCMARDFANIASSTCVVAVMI